MARLVSINDSDWPEVKFINGYAIFIGYLLMGVRGLSVLVVTWTTVVLLGGFVSVIGKKDFWCLTGITLVQTAGVFNFLLKDKLSDIKPLSLGLLGSVLATRSKLFGKKKTSEISTLRAVVALGLSALQLLVFAVLLCPVAVLFVFGLYISAGVSLWRLIEHDFGDGGANLKPALEVLYGLTVAQGVLFGYKAIHYSGAKIGLVEFVAERCSVDRSLILEYLKYIVAGCEKDSSFATGRNLVTYGVDLMMTEASNSNGDDSFISGVKVLSATMDTEDDEFLGRVGLLGCLLTRSASCSHMIQSLLETLDPRSHYTAEDMEHAAKVAANVAFNIRLLRFPEVIQLISGMLDTLTLKEESHDEEEIRCYNDSSWPWVEPKVSSLWVVAKVARILANLATQEDNCRFICSTEGVLSNTVRHLISVQDHARYRFHEDNAWCSLAEGSLELITRLAGAPGGTEAVLNGISGKQRREIQDTIESILECGKCDVPLKRKAVKVLLDLSSIDTSFYTTASPSSIEVFTWMLLHISALPGGVFDEISSYVPWLKERSRIRRSLAREKLELMEGLDVIGDLIRIITVQARNNKYRLVAVRLLRHLCDRQSDYQREAKDAVLEVMPEVLKDILGCGSTSDQVSARSPDIEKGVAPQGNGQEDDASSSQGRNGDEQHEGIKLREALISLCSKMYNEDEDDTDPKLNDMAVKACSDHGIPIPVKDFKSLVSYAQDLLEGEKKEAQRRATERSRVNDEAV